MKIAAIIQARMESERLPGKSMAMIEGYPMLFHVINRVAAILKDIFVITPTDSWEIRSFCNIWGIPYFLDTIKDDLLDSFYKCALEYNIENIIRITGDNPLIDPEMMESLIAFYWQGSFDWASNCRLKTTFPVGNDAEIFSFKTLEKAWFEAKFPYERQNVTPFIYNHGELFKLGLMENNRDLSHLSWTVDTQGGLERIRDIYKKHYKGKIFGMQEILG